ncbi:MAG: ASCH domain-containing protein [Prevotella sp.]|jgi:hypothetical protein|nr:ASCH domain-containing protein [Prevotella sp.]
MKAITIKQPWAHLICAGIKDVENRTWKTKHRGCVYIHAGADKKLDHTPWDMIVTKEQLEDMMKYNTEYEWCKMEFIKSAIIGYVDIIDCIENHPSVWALPNHYHWVLANPFLFEHPILDVKGKLSLWDCSEYLTETHLSKI